MRIPRFMDIHTIGFRVGSSLLAGFAVFVLLDQVLDRREILPRFDAIDHELGASALRRASKALEHELGALESMAVDWGAWDDTYAYVTNPRPAYAEANLVESTFTNSRVNVIAIYNDKMEDIWSKAINLDTREYLPSATALPGELAILYTEMMDKDEAVRSGICQTSLGPMLMAAARVLTSANEGPSRGLFIVGRLLTSEYISSLSEQVESHFEAISLASLAENELGRLSAVREANGIYIEQTGPDSLSVWGEMHDLRGNPSLLLYVKIPRVFYKQGLTIIQSALVSTIGIGVLVLLLTLWRLRTVVVTPLKTLTARAAHVIDTGDLTIPVETPSHDEIGRLAAHFSAMMTRIRQDMERRETSETALAQARHMAAIGEMSASVAHEIRNPLAGISGAVQLLLRKQDAGSQQAELMGEILAQVQRMDEAVSNLLMFARPWIPQRAPVLAGDLLREAITHARLDDAHPGVQAVVEAPVDLRVQADATLLRQVLWNIIRNAIQAMEGEGAIHLKAERVPAGVVLTIADTGPGIYDEQFERLFEPFYTTRTRGTGLGLPVCREIIKAHGGSISIGNRQGGGASVVITLPEGAAS